MLSLGIDTLVVSASLGASGRTALVPTALGFAAAEALMPLVGLAVGRAAGGLVGHWASLAGGVFLCGVAVWMIFLEADDGRDGAGDLPAPRRPGPRGWALVGAALGVSMDELAAGFSIGLVGVPALVTVALVAGQSLLFTAIGLRFGSRLTPYLGERAEGVAGVVLGLLGVWIVVEAVSSLGLSRLALMA